MYKPQAFLAPPQVDGSVDGTTPGSFSSSALGYFDLSGLAPGIYQEDFTGGAFPDDFNSPVVFDDIHGTITLIVQPDITGVPELSTASTFAIGFFFITAMLLRCRKRRNC